jgi:hypothetical protein
MSPALAAIASSATSVPLPLLVATFCLLWSSAFSVAAVRGANKERAALPVTSDEKGALSLARRRKR